MTFLDETRAAYDTIAADYAARFAGELEQLPLERALLCAFAETVTGEIADIGCGTGTTSGVLDKLGARVFGVDLSPGMLAQARAGYPHLRFEQGTMTALDLADGSVGGIVSLFSIIHIPDAELPGVFTEFHRVLAPDGRLLLGFLMGDEPLTRTEAYGHRINLDYYPRLPEPVAKVLQANGFEVRAQTVRHPDPPTEKLPRAYLTARKVESLEATVGSPQ